ncbi:MAG: hypothetical protein R6V85_14570 [Polyangia bacterium]
MKSISSVSKNSPCICPEKEPIWRTIGARTAFLAVLAGLLSVGSVASAQTGGIFEVGKYNDPNGGHSEPERCDLVTSHVSASETQRPVTIETVLAPVGIENYDQSASYPRPVLLAWQAGVQLDGADGPSFTEWKLVRP